MNTHWGRAEMLAGAMGGSLLLGWLGHLMVGTILAIVEVLEGAAQRPLAA